MHGSAFALSHHARRNAMHSFLIWYRWSSADAASGRTANASIWTHLSPICLRERCRHTLDGCRGLEYTWWTPRPRARSNMSEAPSDLCISHTTYRILSRSDNLHGRRMHDNCNILPNQQEDTMVRAGQGEMACSDECNDSLPRARPIVTYTGLGSARRLAPSRAGRWRASARGDLRLCDPQYNGGGDKGGRRRAGTQWFRLTMLMAFPSLLIHTYVEHCLENTSPRSIDTLIAYLHTATSLKTSVAASLVVCYQAAKHLSSFILRFLGRCPSTRRLATSIIDHCATNDNVLAFPTIDHSYSLTSNRTK
jgi:hypothetical protein